MSKQAENLRASTVDELKAKIVELKKSSLTCVFRERLVSWKTQLVCAQSVVRLHVLKQC